MTNHATLSASSSGRWLECPGSVALSQGKADNAGESARWGTACHELSAWCLTGDGLDPEAYRGRVIHAEGFDYTVDTKMIEMVQPYVDYIRTLVETTGGQLLVEQRVDFSAVLGVPDQFGTADAIILAEDTLYVVDLKTGQRAVSPQSSQLKLYGLGALEDFGLVADFERVVLVIAQPSKSAEPNTWETSVDELEAFGRAARQPAQQAAALIGVEDITEIEPHLAPGPHCHDYYCRARATCPKLRAQVSEAVFEDLDALEAESLESGSPTPRAVPSDAEQLAALYAKLDLIEGWCKEIREVTYAAALEGATLPGLKLVQGRAGARAWADEEQAEALLKSMRLKQDEMYKQSLQTPTQIEKALKDSPRKWKKVEPLITRSEGKPALAPEWDKRPALVINVANDFDVVEDNAEDLV